MDISRETLEREIEGSKKALEAHKEGIEIHKIVLAAFEKALEKCPKAEETKLNED